MSVPLLFACMHRTAYRARKQEKEAQGHEALNAPPEDNPSCGDAQEGIIIKHPQIEGLRMGSKGGTQFRKALIKP